LKRVLIASIVTAVTGIIFLPIAYDWFGEGARSARTIITSSTEVKTDCGEVHHLFIVPWELAVEDSDSSGNLDITYWFFCKGGFASFNARFHHNDGNWIVDSTSATTSEKSYDLLLPRGAPGPKVRATPRQPEMELL
jgi:hypothetical protein